MSFFKRKGPKADEAPATGTPDRPAEGVEALAPEAADGADAEAMNSEAAPTQSAAVEAAPDAEADAAEHGSTRRDRRAERGSAGRRRLVPALAAFCAVVLLGGVFVATQHRSVALDVDGEVHEVSTFARDIDALLEAEGVELAEHDLVVPGPGEALSDGAEVVVRTAQEVEFVVDGEYRTMWTTALTATEALQTLATGGRSVSLTASRSGDGRPALDLPLLTGGPVTIAADGEERTVEVPGEADVTGVLRLAEVELSDTDRVSVNVNDSEEPVVTITRVETAQDTRTESIDHDTVERETDDLFVGETRVAEEGSEGERTYTSRQVLIDGEVESAKLMDVEVTTEPTDRVIEVGTAQRPAPEPEPEPEPSSGSESGNSDSSSGSGSGDSGSSDSGSGDSGSGDSGSGDSGSDDSGSDSGGGSGGVPDGVWSQLAQCESGGNPTAVSPSGTYHGLYQFSVATWQSVGGSGLPSQASPAEQTQRAQALQARSGWGQWPACAAQLGLL